MSEFKIDEAHLKSLASEVKETLETISNDADRMLNPAIDIFERYMAFSRLKLIDDALEYAIKLSQGAIRIGFDIQADILKSEAFKKNGWGDISPYGNPFFEQPEEDSPGRPKMRVIDGNKIPEHLKEELFEVLDDVFKAQKEPVIEAEKVH